MSRQRLGARMTLSAVSGFRPDGALHTLSLLRVRLSLRMQLKHYTAVLEQPTLYSFLAAALNTRPPPTF